jgi:hypothetical protein
MSKRAILDSLEFAKNETKEGSKKEKKTKKRTGRGSSTSVRSFDPTVRNEPGDAFWTARY